MIKELKVLLTVVVMVSILKFVGIYAIINIYRVLVLHMAVTNSFTFTHIDKAHKRTIFKSSLMIFKSVPQFTRKLSIIKILAY